MVDEALRLLKTDDACKDEDVVDQYRILDATAVALLWQGILQWENFQVMIIEKILTKQVTQAGTGSASCLISFDKAIVCWSKFLPASAAAKKSLASGQNLDTRLELMDEVIDLLDLLQEHERGIQLLKLMLALVESSSEPDQYILVKLQVCTARFTINIRPKSHTTTGSSAMTSYR